MEMRRAFAVRDRAGDLLLSAHSITAARVQDGESARTVTLVVFHGVLRDRQRLVTAAGDVERDRQLEPAVSAISPSFDRLAVLLLIHQNARHAESRHLAERIELECTGVIGLRLLEQAVMHEERSPAVIGMNVVRVDGQASVVIGERLLVTKPSAERVSDVPPDLIGLRFFWKIAE